MGLLETSFPGTVQNVSHDRFYYLLRNTDNNFVKCVLRNGIYPTIQSVILELQRAQRAAMNLPASTALVNFIYRHRRVHFSFAKDADHILSITFSTDLATMLGYKPNTQYVFRRENRAETPVHLSATINNIYFYCDLLEEVLVGDTKTPLLRIVNRTTRVNEIHDSVEHVTFNPVQYIPLQKKCFDTVEINMMTDTGQPMPFVPGKSLVVLEFRRSAHPYLLL